MSINILSINILRSKINFMNIPAKAMEIPMNLVSAEEGKEYIIRGIETDDEEMDGFLFSLGCYSGEPITVISHMRGGHVVSIKDGRYTIDQELAKAILI